MVPRLVKAGKTVAGEIKIDFARVMERQNKMRHEACAGLESWLRGVQGGTVYAGYGRFLFLYLHTLSLKGK